MEGKKYKEVTGKESGGLGLPSEMPLSLGIVGWLSACDL